jgi:hypothetical protein
MFPEWNFSIRDLFFLHSDAIIGSGQGREAGICLCNAEKVDNSGADYVKYSRLNI